MTTKQSGTSLIEVIFSVGILVIVITAVVSLIVKTSGIKTMEAQRKRASEMSEVIIENLMESKKNNSDDFWQMDDTEKATVAGYEGYSYSLNMNENDECSVGVECIDAVIVISWGDNQTLTVKRFFSNKI